MSTSYQVEDVVQERTFPKDLDFKAAYINLLAGCLMGDTEVISDHEDRFIQLDAERIQREFITKVTV